MTQLDLFPNHVSIPPDSETKICIKCNQNLPLSCYSFHSGANYRRTECKKCNNQLGKDRYKIRLKHGSPPDDYSCPICCRTAEECQGEGNKKNGAWVVDHNHQTNQFRGWLCHSCNRNIGSFKDNPTLLQRAIDYLRD